jgi:hypothetical protein
MVEALLLLDGVHETQRTRPRTWDGPANYLARMDEANRAVEEILVRQGLT